MFYILLPTPSCLPTRDTIGNVTIIGTNKFIICIVIATKNISGSNVVLPKVGDATSGVPIRLPAALDRYSCASIPNVRTVAISRKSEMKQAHIDMIV